MNSDPTTLMFHQTVCLCVIANDFPSTVMQGVRSDRRSVQQGYTVYRTKRPRSSALKMLLNSECGTVVLEDQSEVSCYLYLAHLEQDRSAERNFHIQEDTYEVM